MKKIGVIFAAMLAAQASQAGLIGTYFGLSGSSDTGLIVPGDDFGYEVTVYYGREVSALQNLTGTFSGVFSEAAFESLFNSGGNTLNSKDANKPNKPSFSNNFGVGLMDFDFEVVDTGGTVANGDNEAAWDAAGTPDAPPTFLVAEFQNALYLGLNDDGEDIDVDFDDFVVKVTVPEPSSTAILSLGLIGLGLTRLARKKQ